jgi:hypothetical protein
MHGRVNGIDPESQKRASEQFIFVLNRTGHGEQPI